MHSSNKSKKKHKQVKIKIEKPDIELHPMSHYADDRVELIKQVFSTLKSKTIRNLAPDNLKKCTIQEIEELCLNEILGISTKRLLSIMNATKCPTDTESSSDSDVHNIEEHISLEEISSDTEEEFTKPKKLSKKVKKTAAKSEEKVTEKKNEDDDKEISVLELLELQARARAIRSQLAQEPVTKIEVDSDESENVTDKKKQMSSNAINKERSSSGKIPQSKQNAATTSNKETEIKIVNGGSSNNTEPAIKNAAKKIKLKRNFRKPQPQDSEDNETKDDSTNFVAQEKQMEKPSEKEVMKVDEKNLEKENVSSATDQTDSKADDKLDKKDADDDRNRKSPSPDVITILPSPETLFISDSSDNDDGGTDKGKTTQTASTKSSIVAATTVNSTTTYSIKEQQSKPAEIGKRKLSQENIVEKDKEEKSNEKETEILKNVPPEEIEDGEILDHDDKEQEKENENDQEDEKCNDSKNKSKEKDDSPVHHKKKTKKSRNDDDQKCTEQTNEDNQNDDVISLGNDLDYEIRDDLEENQTRGNLSVNGGNDKSKSPIQENVSTKNSVAVSKSESSGSEHSNSSMNKEKKEELEELESNKNSPSKNTTKSSDDDDEEQIEEIYEEKEDEDVNEAMDYIELHDSSEDELDTNSQNPDENSQSWNERWLKSHKVKKILAQSRLSNRVRDKIKQNKTNETNKKIIEEQQQQQQLEIAKEKDKFESKFEDGSMQQYKEIKDREQTNSNLEKND